MEATNEAAADKLLITTARLEGWDACDSGREWFAEKFLSGEAQYAEVYEALQADKREDDADWLFRRVFIWDDSVCGALAPMAQVALPASQHAEVLFGSKKSVEVTLQRSWMSFDWLVREHLPTWLERSTACAEHAAKLRALAPITSEQQLADAQVALDQARRAAAAWAAARDAARAAARAAAWDAARDAAWAAAWAAARDAAWAAAWDAAWAAARDAAWDAAWAAARDAAWDAAWAAAWDAARDAAQKGELNVDDDYARCREVMDAALKPTQALLQDGAQDLFLRMVNVELRELSATIEC